MTTPETGNRANEEMNIRRALSSIYEAQVQGVAQEDGTLWDIGQIVKVNDPFAGMRGLLLIKEVEYSVNLGEGTTTGLVCVPPDAYSGRGVTTGTDARKTSVGERFQKSDGSSAETFVR